MFYSQFILAKKGPLGTIWIAAHLERKLRKNQVADTDIGVSVDSILFPEVPIALRLSSHLLLGVVRIYSKKVNYLFDDCSDALLKVKQAFRSTAVDLPPEQSKAPYHSITLPETFDLDDFELPDNEAFQGNFVDRHVSTREQITLQDTMDGVTFSTSQFGPDERFGDGDASQIGLDLDEELFMDKGDAAGTSGMFVDTDAHASTSEASPSKVNEHNAGISDPPLASSANHFVIQAPSTPGLTEEPNLPSTKEEIQVSDDHMDEDPNPCDPNPCEVAAKEVSGTLSFPVGPSDFIGAEPLSNGNVHHMEELDNEKVKTLKTESIEFTLSEIAQPAASNDHIDGTKGQDSVGNILNSSALDNEMAADVQSKGRCKDTEIDINETAQPVAENVIVMEVEDAGCNKTELNGTYHPLVDSGAQNDKSSVGSPLHGTVDAATCDSQLNHSFQSCLNLNNVETTESNLDEKLSDVATPILQACSSKVLVGCDGTADLVDTSCLQAQDDGPSSIGMSGREDATKVIEMTTNVETSKSNLDEKSSDVATPILQACTSKVHVACDGATNLVDTSCLTAQDDGPSSIGMSGQEDATEMTANVGDVVEPTSKADQAAYGVTFAADSNLGGQLDNVVAEENQLEKENKSDFPPPEVLLSMPNLPAGLSDNFLVDSTPGKEVLVTDREAVDDNVISGRKRSFTESTLTVQSFNSIESPGGAQSKGTGESIPDDNDLLSSILAGKKSTTFKMKPTPPVSDTVRAKRQRTAVRSVPHKRKVLVDDSTVLHGDTIRQQLTNTEDIRRVRKKAPCTDLEVWVLQKQFLEDEIFSEPVFTGMYPVLLSLGSEAFDLNKIKILQEDGNKGASGADISEKPIYNEEDEAAGSLVSSIADISVRPNIDEKAEAVGTPVPSIVANHGLQGSLLSEPCEKESTVIDSTTLPKDVEAEDNEVMKQVSQNDVTEEKVDTESAEVRTPVCDEAVHSIASVVEPVASVDHVPEVACNPTDHIKVNSPSLNNSSDVMMPMHIDVSDQLLDQRCNAQCSTGDATTVEDVSGLGIPHQGVQVGVSDKVDLDERSDGELLSEKREGVDTDIVMGHVQDSCSLPVDDFSISGAMALEDRVCPTSDHVVEKCHLDEHETASKDETSITGLGHDGSNLISHNVDEHVKLDSPCTVEANLSSQSTNLDEKEGLQHWELDPMIVMDSTPVPNKFIDSGNNAEFGTDSIQHDTDFLNVDDDDVEEDYESDMPDNEEKRILDNSGWSTRTRAVANYLQGLFEKESVQAKKAISLDSLLVGKSRKEASRMFFETLVLKTKDYVQAEQECSFGDIKIKPRGKLLKSEF